MEPAIRVEGLGKRYVLGRRSGRRELWALRGLDFEVGRGEIVGLLGRNGAGKTTLLRLISGITEPSEGRILLRGRVAGLLDVGTGLHPEMTGRENLMISGVIHGLSRGQVQSRFDEIVALAGLERFLDVPLKRFSAGMWVRLAFAVTAYLDAEILLVDEVLSLADEDFREESLGLLRRASGRGQTVVFVSHSRETVAALCPRGLLLDGGRLAGDASIHDVLGGDGR